MSKKTPLYVVFEGGEGCYKSTTISNVFNELTSLGFNVLQTKEPGTNHLPITMKLREIVLDSSNADQLTPIASELIKQAIRSIHIEKLIRPIYNSSEYDFILQDRGQLSGRIYAEMLGVNQVASSIVQLTTKNPISTKSPFSLSDLTIIMHRSDSNGLSIAKQAKKEFESGDCIESLGSEFHDGVNSLFKRCIPKQVSTHDESYHNTLYKKAAWTNEIIGVNVQEYDNKQLELSQTICEFLIEKYNDKTNSRKQD